MNLSPRKKLGIYLAAASLGIAVGYGIMRRTEPAAQRVSDVIQLPTETSSFGDKDVGNITKPEEKTIEDILRGTSIYVIDHQQHHQLLRAPGITVAALYYHESAAAHSLARLMRSLSSDYPDVHFVMHPHYLLREEPIIFLDILVDGKRERLDATEMKWDNEGAELLRNYLKKIYKKQELNGRTQPGIEL